MDIYITEQGDTFDKIAYDQLDDCLLVDALMQANLPLLDTAIFPAGVEVIIPDVDDYGAMDDELLPDADDTDLADDADSDDDAVYDEDPNVDDEDDAYDGYDEDEPADGSGIDW